MRVYKVSIVGDEPRKHELMLALKSRGALLSKARFTAFEKSIVRLFTVVTHREPPRLQERRRFASRSAGITATISGAKAWLFCTVIAIAASATDCLYGERVGFRRKYVVALVDEVLLPDATYQATTRWGKWIV